MTAQKRIEWLDAIRGLGIMLVILGHTTIPPIARRFIFSFHMPLFFFISGWLFNNNFSKAWCLKKCDGLLVPYLLYGAITIPIVHFSVNAPMDLLLWGFLRGNGVGVLWFLMCLLVVELWGGAIVRLAGSRFYVLCFCMVAAGTLGWVVPKLVWPGVLCIRTVPAALAFWLAGYGCRMFFGEHKVKGAWLWSGVAIMGCVGSMFVVQRVDMASANYGNVFLFYGTALSLVVLVFMAFAQLDNTPVTRLFAFFGRISLGLMCLHELVPVLLNMTGCGKMIVRILSMLVLVLMAYAIHRWVPILSGKAVVFRRLEK